MPFNFGADLDRGPDPGISNRNLSLRVAGSTTLAQVYRPETVYRLRGNEVNELGTFPVDYRN